MSAEHVQALNLIDVMFGKGDAKDMKVISAWSAYIDHLGTNARIEPALWNKTTQDLFLKLLVDMGRVFDFSLDRTHIKNTSYYPTGYDEFEKDNAAIRKGMVAAYAEGGALAIKIVGDTPMPSA